MIAKTRRVKRSVSKVDITIDTFESQPLPGQKVRGPLKREAAAALKQPLCIHPSSASLYSLTLFSLRRLCSPV